MRKLNAILNDYPNTTKAIFSFGPDDFDRIDNVWDNPEEPNLQRFQTLDAFKGYKRWADLKPGHFRILITRMIQKVSALSEAERVDTNKIEVGALTILILAYVRCLEHRTGSQIDLFKINVISATNLNFEFSAEVDLAFDVPQPRAELFKIAVDNTESLKDS